MYVFDLSLNKLFALNVFYGLFRKVYVLLKQLVDKSPALNRKCFLLEYFRLIVFIIMVMRRAMYIFCVLYYYFIRERRYFLKKLLINCANSSRLLFMSGSRRK